MMSKPPILSSTHPILRLKERGVALLITLTAVVVLSIVIIDLSRQSNLSRQKTNKQLLKNMFLNKC